MLTWGHLRHSHIWIPFQGLAGKLFQSPAHHQVHHSTDPRHFDKNLGFALAVWDWAFGTLHIPAREREVSEYGVGERIRGLRDRRALADAAFREGRRDLDRGRAPLAGDISRSLKPIRGFPVRRRNICRAGTCPTS